MKYGVVYRIGQVYKAVSATDIQRSPIQRTIAGLALRGGLSLEVKKGGKGGTTTLIARAELQLANMAHI
jgi:hypothetical protein